MMYYIIYIYNYYRLQLYFYRGMKKYSIWFIKMNNYNTFSKLVYCQFVYLKYYSVNGYHTGILQFAIDNPRRFIILLHYNCSERVILRYACMSLLNHEYKFVLSSLSNFFFSKITVIYYYYCCFYQPVWRFLVRVGLRERATNWYRQNIAIQKKFDFHW